MWSIHQISDITFDITILPEEIEDIIMDYVYQMDLSMSLVEQLDNGRM